MAVVEEGFTSLRECLEQAKATSGDDSREQLCAIGIAYVKFALTHPAHYRVMFGNYRNDSCESASLAEVAEQSFMVLVNIIREGQEMGVFRETNTLNLARTAWSLVHGQAMLTLDHRFKMTTDEDFTSFLNLSVQTLVQGIQSRYAS